jgi:hypothetical protein
MTGAGQGFGGVGRPAGIAPDTPMQKVLPPRVDDPGDNDLPPVAG